MKKVIVVILVLLFLALSVISCQNKDSEAATEKEEPTSEKKLEMYQMSEMAALMEQMYLLLSQKSQQLIFLLLRIDSLSRYVM